MRMGPLECSTLTDAGRYSVVCLHSLTAPSFTAPSCQSARTYTADRLANNNLRVTLMDIGTANAPVCEQTARKTCHSRYSAHTARSRSCPTQVSAQQTANGAPQAFLVSSVADAAVLAAHAQRKRYTSYAAHTRPSFIGATRK